MAEDDSLSRRNAMSFQSGAVNSSSDVMMTIPYASSSTAGMNLNLNMDMMYPGNSSLIGNSSLAPASAHAHAHGFIQPAANSSSSSTTSLSISIPGLKHDAGLAVEWTVEEQFKLEQGLLNYANEPNIMKYIRIASTLQDKTVRDVAMRCRWMTRKRRKADEHYFGKKVNNRKDKLVELNSKTNIPSVMQQNNPAYPVTLQHMDRNVPISFEVLGISGTTRHLLEQNALAFSQIRANLSTFKLQDNIELFCRTRNNISAILNDMRCTPGIMSQMPPLLESINEDLANSILPSTSQSRMLSSPIGIQLKQEPRC